jgi:membrane-associated protease RseP (regulator of RpoE activity)
LLILGGVAALALGAVLFSAVRAGDDADKDKTKKVVIFRSGGSWLGVQIADIDADRAREIGLKEEMGAEIQSVSEDSPAEKAGLKKGDVILEYQGTRIEGVAQLTRLVRETPAGRNASLRVWSNGSTRSVQVQVAERDRERYRHWEHAPHPSWAPEAPEPPEPPLIDLEGFDIPDVQVLVGPHGGPRLGAVVDTVGKQLAEYFGVKQGGGVLVKSVNKEGPGAKAGLRAGDIIVRVDDAQVEDEGDLRMALRERRGKEFKMTVVRDRREQSLTIPAPPEDRRASPSAMPPRDRERIRREVQRAMKEAAVARTQAAEEIRQAYQEALRSAQEQVQEQVQDQVQEQLQEQEDAVEPDEVDSGADSIHDQQQQERDDIRRAVEEARRIRIQMQESMDE